MDRAFGDGVLAGVILPILGMVFLPWTTALYIVGFMLGGAASPWGFLGIAIGLFLDVAVHAGSATMTRKRYAG